MLVLTRKSNQSIMIGDDIEVSVLSIMGEKVRIGIQAPRDIPVFRKEVYLEIQQENVAAGATARAEVDDALKRLSANNRRRGPLARAARSTASANIAYVTTAAVAIRTSTSSQKRIDPCRCVRLACRSRSAPLGALA